MPRRDHYDQLLAGFKGFNSPNYTQVPDELFDVLMPALSDAELRVLLYIVRRTFGFKRERDNISLSQLVHGITTTDGRVLDRGAGLSKAAAAKAVKSLAEKGIINSTRNRSAEKGDEPTTYELKFQPTPVSTKKTGGSLPGGHPRVHDVDTQETGIQKTVKPSNLRKAHAKNTGKEPGDTGTLSEPIALHQSLSHSLNERSHAVPPAAAPGSSIGNSGPRAAESLDSTHFVTQNDPSSNEESAGYRLLRDQVMKFRGAAPQPEQSSSFDPAASSERPLAAILPIAKGRASGSSDDRELIGTYLEDFRHFLGDEAAISSSISRTINIFISASIPRERWVDLLYQANSITKERTQHIQKKPGSKGSGFAAKNRAPYFFAVLEDLCGLRVHDESLVPSTP